MKKKTLLLHEINQTKTETVIYAGIVIIGMLSAIAFWGWVAWHFISRWW